MSNSLFLIQPYRFAGMWVFDYPPLVSEPFVSGIPEILDKALSLKTLPPNEKFTMVFSAIPFPQHDYVLRWDREDAEGNWYVWEQEKMEGWLCPALFEFFVDAPKQIYVQLLGIVP